MKDKIKNWLIRPYPFPLHSKDKIIISVAIGVFINLFLIIFKPFDLYSLSEGDILNYSMVYGLITTSVFIILFLILPIIFIKYFNPSTWNIGKMTFVIIAAILVISILNWLMSGYSSFNKKGSEYTFMFFIYTAFLIGIFPTIIYVHISEFIISNKHKSVAENLSKKQKQVSKILDKQKIIIKGENKKDNLEIYINELLYISFEKNYASVFHVFDNKIKETLLRIPLNKVEKQLSSYNFIVRCHKSYIVNANHVEKINGNARGYLLQIVNSSKLIPVSRSFPKELLFTLVG